MRALIAWLGGGDQGRGRARAWPREKLNADLLANLVGNSPMGAVKDQHRSGGRSGHEVGIAAARMGVSRAAAFF